MHFNLHHGEFLFLLKYFLAIYNMNQETLNNTDQFDSQFGSSRAAAPDATHSQGSPSHRNRGFL